MAPRQLKRYRVHTIYKPHTWLTINGSFSDLERHNNTNNNAVAVAAGDDPYEGPLDHVDHSRIASVGAVVTKNEHYGFDFNYSYSDVYSATNICFDNGNQTPSTKPGTYPGTATLTAGGAPNVCPGVFGRGSTTQLADWFGRDFMDAPSQYGYAALMLTPTPKVKSDIGYTVSAVNGTRFFTDARDVNGSLVSTYESPYVNIAYSMRPSLIWKAQYNFYGYGEGGPSGPQYCSLSTSTTSTGFAVHELHRRNWRHRIDWTGLGRDRAAQLPCQQCRFGSALRVLGVGNIPAWIPRGRKEHVLEDRKSNYTGGSSRNGSHAGVCSGSRHLQSQMPDVSRRHRAGRHRGGQEP